MPTNKEVMQQALDALDLVTDLTTHDDVLYEAIDALRAQLAQPEPEELALLEEAMIEAWKPIPADEEQLKRIAKLVGQEPLWIRNEEGKLELHAPPQREWQGLTDEEIDKLAEAHLDFNWHEGVEEFARAIEAKLKEKNGV